MSIQNKFSFLKRKGYRGGGTIYADNALNITQNNV